MNKKTLYLVFIFLQLNTNTSSTKFFLITITTIVSAKYLIEHDQIINEINYLISGKNFNLKKEYNQLFNIPINIRK